METQKNIGKLWRFFKVFYFLLTIPFTGVVFFLVLNGQRLYRGSGYFSVNDYYSGIIYAIFVLIGYVIVTDFLKRTVSYINSGEFEGIFSYGRMIINFGIPFVIIGAIFITSMFGLSDSLRKECTGKNEGFNNEGLCLCDEGYQFSNEKKLCFSPTVEEYSFISKGTKFFNVGNYNEAIIYYNQALKFNSNNILVLYNIGGAYFNQGKNQEALSYYDKILKINAQHIDSLNGKGNSLRAMGKNQEALGYFDDVLDIEPENINALANKGGVLLTLGKNEAAIYFLDEVLKIKPNHINALTNKILALYQQGNFQEAKSFLNQAIVIAPNDENIRKLTKQLLNKE